MKVWMILVGLVLAAVAFGVAACADDPDEELDLLRLPVKGFDIGDDCRLVGYVWAWVSASTASQEQDGTVGPPTAGPDTNLLETLRANIGRYDTWPENIKDLCRREGSRAAAMAASDYRTGKAPIYQDLLSDYWEP